MDKLIQVFKIIGIVLGICLLAVPFIVFYSYLKTQKKTIILSPEFKVVDVENRDDVDAELLKQGLEKFKMFTK